VEFLELPDHFHENDFRKALVKGMRDFILELGNDFSFVGEDKVILRKKLQELASLPGIKEHTVGIDFGRNIIGKSGFSWQ
jgi:hypothetical protein